MPELFPDIPSFVACALVMAGAQMLYATVGFGAGMFSVALLAMVLPGLRGPVTVLLLLTFVTEVWVLTHDWRRARGRLLIGLVPAMAVGLWLGTDILVGGDVATLKRLLGLLVGGAGLWFLIEQRVRSPQNDTQNADGAGDDERPETHHRAPRLWLAAPIGLVSGILGGLFGTGGPPVIVLLRAYRLDKGAFRATLLWYFFLMSLFRGGTYLRAGLITRDVLYAALWLLPASIGGILVGMAIHRRLPEQRFATATSVMLIVLGVLLAAGLRR